MAALVHRERHCPGEASLSDLLKHNNPCVCSLFQHKPHGRTLSSNPIHVLMCVLYDFVCPFFLLQLEYPSKAPHPHSMYLLPPGNTGVSVLCYTFQPQSLSFFTLHPVSFFPVFPLFSFLSVFPLTALLYLSCFMLPPRWLLLSLLPPPVHLTPAPFPFRCIFLSYTVLLALLSQGLRRSSS